MRERQPDGTWLQARRHPGRVWFEVDVPAGEPSKWLTLSGTRVLQWWDFSAGGAAVGYYPAAVERKRRTSRLNWPGASTLLRWPIPGSTSGGSEPAQPA